MKKLFTILAVAATLVSCAKDETIAVNKGEAIQFGNAFVENSTRAAVDPSYNATNLKSFKVYGTVNNVNIFNGVEVTGTVGGTWTYNENYNQYWIAGASYKFVGIVDGNKTGVTETNLTNNMPTTISYTADGKTDLLCKTVTKTAKTDGTSNGPVNFEFTHLLSKVNFTVTNNSATANGYSFVVKNITFNGATSATYNVATATWNTPATAIGNTVIGNERTVKDNENKDVKVKDIVVASGAASAELGTEVLFIPGEYTITFTVDILYNENVITTTNYPATGTTYKHTLVAANAYNFNVDVAVGELITFSVATAPTWDADQNNDNAVDEKDYIELQ